MKPIPPTPPGVKTAWADPEHMRLVRSLIEGWTDRPELVKRRRGQAVVDPWTAPAEVVERVLAFHRDHGVSWEAGGTELICADCCKVLWRRGDSGDAA